MGVKKQKIKFEKEAREALARGADILAKAVTSTFGPLSRNVAINEYPEPIIIHDGVTVASRIHLEDDFEDMGASLLRNAAFRTNSLAGDGTTTATLIANYLIQEGMKIIAADITNGRLTAVNPMILKNRFLEMSDFICNEVDKHTKKIKTLEEKINVATVSAGDLQIGKMIAEAVDKVGEEGLIMVEDSLEFETNVKYETGMEFSNGYLSPYFITDPHREEVRYSGDEHYVLITDRLISDPMELVPVLEKVIKEGKNKKALVIIADDVVGAALTSLALMKLKTGTPIVAVKAPEYGEMRHAALEDIAVLTGGVVISKDLGKSLKDVELSDLGRVKTIEVTKTHTRLTPKNIDKKDLKDRCNIIREQIKTEKNDFVKNRLRQRLGKLSQNIAIINVGGASESEVVEKRERIRDAVYATQAAIADGIVAGGGVVLMNIYKTIKDDSEIDALVKNMLTVPFKTLLKNSGLPDSLFDELLSKDNNIGYNLISNEWGDMFKMGITDPAKVTKMAIRHAMSVAAMILTTDVLVTDIEDKNVQNIRVVNNHE